MAKPKLAEKSLNELIRALIKFLPVMYVSVRHDICYYF